MKVATSIVVAAALALSGCGGQNNDPLSVTERARLAPLVREIRRTAESFDRRGAQRALAQLQVAVSSDQGRGDISAARAAEILTAAAQVRSRLALVPATTTTTTTTTTPPDGPPGPGNKKHDHGPGGKHGGD